MTCTPSAFPLAVLAEATRICSVDGCQKIAQARGWCPMHYQRWRHHGDPLVFTPRGPRERPPKPRAPDEKPCSLKGCERALQAQGLCHRHYEYARRRGEIVTGYSKARGANPFWKGDEVGIKAVHLRLNRERGRAKDFRCMDCGLPAFDWAFDEPTGFSIDLSRYRPLCRACHMRSDGRSNALGRRS